MNVRLVRSNQAAIEPNQLENLDNRTNYVPLSNRDLLAQNANDPSTKRGKKL